METWHTNTYICHERCVHMPMKQKDNCKCVCVVLKRAVLQPAFNLVYAIPPWLDGNLQSFQHKIVCIFFSCKQFKIYSYICKYVCKYVCTPMWKCMCVSVFINKYKYFNSQCCHSANTVECEERNKRRQRKCDSTSGDSEKLASAKGSTITY